MWRIKCQIALSVNCLKVYSIFSSHCKFLSLYEHYFLRTSLYKCSLKDLFRNKITSFQSRNKEERFRSLSTNSGCGMREQYCKLKLILIPHWKWKQFNSVMYNWSWNCWIRKLVYKPCLWQIRNFARASNTEIYFKPFLNLQYTSYYIDTLTNYMLFDSDHWYRTGP